MLFNTQIKKYEQLPGLNYVDLFWSSGIKFSAMICLFRMEEHVICACSATRCGTKAKRLDLALIMFVWSYYLRMSEWLGEYLLKANAVLYETYSHAF